MSDWMKTAHLQDTAGSSLIRWNYKYYTHVQFCVTKPAFFHLQRKVLGRSGDGKNTAEFGQLQTWPQLTL